VVKGSRKSLSWRRRSGDRLADGRQGRVVVKRRDNAVAHDAELLPQRRQVDVYRLAI